MIRPTSALQHRPQASADCLTLPTLTHYHPRPPMTTHAHPRIPALTYTPPTTTHASPTTTREHPRLLAVPRPQVLRRVIAPRMTLGRESFPPVMSSGR